MVLVGDGRVSWDGPGLFPDATVGRGRRSYGGKAVRTKIGTYLNEGTNEELRGSMADAR